MDRPRLFQDEDIVKLSQACGVSHDLAEIMRENFKASEQDKRLAGHLDFITKTLEQIINKHENTAQ